MSGINWEKFGEEISRTVQDAVENQNYDKLNQMITDMVNKAVDTVGNGVKNVINGSQTKCQEGKTNQKKTSYSAYKSYTTDQGKSNYGTSSFKKTSGIQYSNVRQGHPEKTAVAISKKAPSKVGAVLLSAGGYLFGGIQALWTIGFLVLTIIPDQSFGTAHRILSIIMGLLTGALAFAGLRLGIGQARKVGRIERFSKYLRAIGKKEYYNVSELAAITSENEKTVLKDLEYMIKKHWFLEGHLDKQKTCLIVTDRMYSEYCQLEKRKEIADQDAKEQSAKQKKILDEKIAAGEMLPLEVQKVVERGEESIRKIRACNDAIPGEEISAKIDSIEMLVDKIFDRVEQNPKSVSDIQKLTDYYLPTTVKLLEAYAEMDAQPIGGENIQNAKREIEATLDTLNVAFEKLLDSLFQETAWDVSSDISVLNTMLAQEGLKEDGLKRK